MKCRAQLEKEFVSCGMAIRSLRLQEKEHRKSSKAELAKFQSWYDPEVISSYRSSAVSKLVQIRAEIAYEDKKSLVVQTALRVRTNSQYTIEILILILYCNRKQNRELLFVKNLNPNHSLDWGRLL